MSPSTPHDYSSDSIREPNHSDAPSYENPVHDLFELFNAADVVDDPDSPPDEERSPAADADAPPPFG